MDLKQVAQPLYDARGCGTGWRQGAAAPRRVPNVSSHTATNLPATTSSPNITAERGPVVGGRLSYHPAWNRWSAKTGGTKSEDTRRDGR